MAKAPTSTKLDYAYQVQSTSLGHVLITRYVLVKVNAKTIVVLENGMKRSYPKNANGTSFHMTIKDAQKQVRKLGTEMRRQLNERLRTLDRSLDNAKFKMQVVEHEPFKITTRLKAGLNL